MPNYRRNFVPGGIYFFTAVTHLRQPFLTSDLARKCLREAIEEVREDHPFEMIAQVLLPDHWHTIWQLPEGDVAYPMRWSRIKELFTRKWLEAGGEEFQQSESRIKYRRRGVWQKRYWEHTVDGPQDLKRCVDYVHWNPRKHAFVQRVADWSLSSFHRYVDAGEYTIDWGGTDPVPNWHAPEWGE
ncbi:REP-associated tyrosine transposase [Adhaeretor mobilis]|uniref:Transposase IS200 like protein n=1 Tax=Adhaeretor mobilis TaxID=1930276 RepID=A0A517N2G7_9BACT|nr:transposase [Adhaeretor mobilis]QDT01321.1 Transposase IS200 like protein [Adhaeretor mobilis]